LPGSNVIVRDLKVDEKQSVTKHLNCATRCVFAFVHLPTDNTSLNKLITVEYQYNEILGTSEINLL